MHLVYYLDPGSGSFIVQLVAGGVAGIVVTGKLYWRRFRSFIGLGNRSDEQ